MSQGLVQARKVVEDEPMRRVEPELEMAVVAAYDVESVGPDEPKVRNITSVPRHGARIRVTPR